MPLLLAQLGDIHFKEANDPAVARAPSIGAAIAAEVDSNVHTVVLAVCGDAAYSGTKKQFEIARQFVEAIEQEIHARCKDVIVVRSGVPGNHDCDFSGDQAARDNLLTSVKESEKPAKSIIDIVMTPLKEYFTFAKSLAQDTSITHEHPFYRAVDLPDGDGTLRLHLLNTAWMSSIHEQPGSLHFPLTEIAPPATLADCSIAVLHHPSNWFSQPHAMRPLRDRLADLASVVLVNHEHTPEAREEVPLMDRDGTATKTIYVSGGVIQEFGQKDRCSFNLLRFDVTSKSLTLTRHECHGGGTFFERTGNETVSLSETDLSVGPAGVSLHEDMVNELEDPGAPITHPRRDPRSPIRLSDVFLYPDLWELNAEHDGEDQKQIKSADVPEKVLEGDRVLITGGEKSGRTAIVKTLFRDAFNRGMVPIYLTGSEMPKKADAVRKAVRNAVPRQYAKLAADAYEQLPLEKRVVLVDDVHRMSPASATRCAILAELERLFGKVVLCGDDLIKLDELDGRDARDSGLWDYRHLVIVGFGEFLREQFVRQWLMLGGDTIGDDELESEVDRICQLLNIVIKKQLLPSYPLFLIVVLQQSDLANTSVQGGSFGKLFEGVITAILNKSSFHQIGINDKYHYLAALARQFYDGQTLDIAIADAKAWHAAYWADIEIDVSFERLITDLTTLGILSDSGAALKFKYAYFFCYFLAYNLNHNVHDDDSRIIIRTLCQQLHHRISADVVLFLAHLTGDPIVMDEMVKTCESLFSDFEPANLDGDVEPLNRLGDLVGTIAIPEGPNENRQKLKMQRDELVAERLAATKGTQELVPPEADNDAIRRVYDMHAAFKTIQILGQALRNVSGSASKSRKEEVIGKIIGLSCRLLGMFFSSFKDETLSRIVEDLSAAHKEHHPELADGEVRHEVCKHLNGLSQFVCFSMIKHTTFSVGAENLAPTIRRVLGASDETLDRVFNLSFDLERPRAFPRDQALKLYGDLGRNDFSAGLVRILVAHHIYLYVVPFQDRQAISDKMNIKFLPSVMDKSRKRLTN